MDSTLAELIEEMRHGRFGDTFLPNPPITLAEIEEAEKSLPFPLPKFYKEFLLLANGGEFFHDTFFGIHPPNREPAELLHPQTLHRIEQFIAEPRRDRFWRRLPSYTMQQMIDNYNLVKRTDPHIFYDDYELYESEVVDDADKLILLGRVDTGNLFLAKPNDETLYFYWLGDAVEKSEDGSFLQTLQCSVNWWEERETEWEQLPWAAKTYHRFLNWFGWSVYKYV